MNAHTTTLLVIGGGPGGYVAAIRAGQLGIPTTLVEGAALGGTCLNVGCIPSKALIHAAEEFEKTCHFADGSALGISVPSSSIDLEQTTRWKDGIVSRMTGGVAGLLKKHGVHVVKGWANIVDGKTVEIVREGETPQRIGCQHLLIATGSHATELPFMPFGGTVISATEALSPKAVPENLVVVGAGYIGLELGIAYSKLGAHVSVVEAQDAVLPAYDADLTKPVANSLKGLGVDLHLSSSVLGLSADKSAVRVRGPKGDEFELPASQVLVAVGRRPRTKGFGLERIMLDMDGPFIKVNEECRTSMTDVWAIGDVTGEPMLAHRAMAQGEMVAEIIAGKTRRFEPAAIPAVCFTDPELVVVGLTPQQAKAADMDCIDAIFPFAANGRSMTLESKDGFVRVVARRDNHLVVGWQAVGKGVSELSAAFSQSIEMGARLEDIGGTIHAHPTLGEAIQEAALRALGHALHI